jgi:hypothetical protein
VAAGIAEEEEALEEFDVGGGGDHVHSDGDEGLGFLVAFGLGGCKSCR